MTKRRTRNLCSSVWALRRKEILTFCLILAGEKKIVSQIIQSQIKLTLWEDKDLSDQINWLPRK